jgi:hypothetical protein
MACGVSTVARLGLLAALAIGACRKSESDADLSPRLDAAASPSGMGEPDAEADNDAAGKFEPPGGDFGVVPIGQASAPQSFAFTNDGEQPVGPLATRTRLGGADPDSFLVVEDLCQGATLPSAGTCSVTLRFAPQTVGKLAASLTLTMAMRTAVLVVGGTGLAP